VPGSPERTSRIPRRGSPSSCLISLANPPRADIAAVVAIPATRFPGRPNVRAVTKEGGKSAVACAGMSCNSMQGLASPSAIW